MRTWSRYRYPLVKRYLRTASSICVFLPFILDMFQLRLSVLMESTISITALLLETFHLFQHPFRNCSDNRYRNQVARLFVCLGIRYGNDKVLRKAPQIGCNSKMPKSLDLSKIFWMFLYHFCKNTHTSMHNFVNISMPLYTTIVVWTRGSVDCVKAKDLENRHYLFICEILNVICQSNGHRTSFHEKPCALIAQARLWEGAHCKVRFFSTTVDF